MISSQQHTMPNKAIYNNWLDICRGLAILLVLLSHGRTFLIPIAPSFQFFKFGGFLGVELFFVLSGFLIGSILIEKTLTAPNFTKEIPRFLLRRWLRTYPNYILFIIINYALLIDGIRTAPPPALIKYFTFTQALFTPHDSFFNEAWSLAIEEWFYLITPILIGLLSKIFKTKSIALIFCCLVLLFIPLLTRTIFVLNHDWSFNEIRSTTLLRIDSIMIGVIFAWIIKRKPFPDSLVRILAWGLLIIFICVAYLASKEDSFFDNTFCKIFLFPIADLGCAGVIVFGLGLKIRKMTSYFFSILARCSYSAYLMNTPVIVLLRQLSWPENSFFIQWMFYMLATLLFSWIIYLAFEKPMLKIRDNLVER